MPRAAYHICELAPVFVPMLDELIQTAHNESRYGALAPVSKARVADVVRRALHDDEYCAWIALSEDASRLVGVLYVYRQQYLFSDAQFGSDLLFYILPDCRGHTIATQFLKLFEEWCVRHACAQMTISTTSGIARDKVARFFRIGGYDHVGSNFAKSIDI